MSGFPPFPPTSRYSPGRPYGDRPLYPDQVLPPPPVRDYAPYLYPGSAPPPPTFRPYDAYSAGPSAPYSYDQPRRSLEDNYDPYQPGASAYDPGVPALRLPPATYPSPQRTEPARAPSQRPPARQSPPRSTGPPPARYDTRGGDVQELSLLTAPTTINLSDFTTAVHALPASHLPLTKFVSVNRDDAIDLHRQMCTRVTTVWYADGSSRAGEGWSAAVEWILDPGRSGSKMRGCVGEGDALDAELGGIYKAVEGFQELLQQSIKNATPMSHELTVFCDSQAAIVSIDTSSRPESLRFCKLWRSICTDYLHAQMNLIWIPKNSNIEGHVLADKIAVVGASNSYLKKKKEGSLPDIYRRPGGGEPAPAGSIEAGPWQRGDADPSRRKTPFERPVPVPLPISPGLLPQYHQHDANGLRLDLQPQAASGEGYPGTSEPEEEGPQPREGSIFVTHFPDEVSAKDLGILFAQFGEIVAVDIYHISPSLPRFAFVAYTDPNSGIAAIADLHGQPINLDSPFAQENRSELGAWTNWSGRLTVVIAEPPRLVPSSVSADFPDLPDWALGIKDQKSDEAEKMEVDAQIKQERDSSPESMSRKRERQPRSKEQHRSNSASTTGSPSPRKRTRQEATSTAAHAPQVDYGNAVPPPQVLQAPSVAVKTEPGIEANVQPDPSTHVPIAGASIPQSLLQPNASTHLPPPALPPFPPTLKADVPFKTTPQSATALLPTIDGLHPHQQLPHSGTSSTLPPTPNTAERPMVISEMTRSPPRQLSLEPSQSSSKRPLTNSASEPQEYPIKIGVKTLRAQIELVRTSFGKVDVNNWIAHVCFIASDLDQARRVLKDDLYATDGAFLSGRDLEQTLAARGFTPQRVDIFINKVLKVLDGIAMADEAEDADAAGKNDSVQALEQDLIKALDRYPEQTKEAVASAAKLMEYLVRGKEAQERKRLEVERRVKVLEGMVKIGEVVGGVVRFLLTEDKA